MKDQKMKNPLQYRHYESIPLCYEITIIVKAHYDTDDYNRT